MILHDTTSKRHNITILKIIPMDIQFSSAKNARESPIKTRRETGKTIQKSPQREQNTIYKAKGPAKGLRKT